MSMIDCASLFVSLFFPKPGVYTVKFPPLSPAYDGAVSSAADSVTNVVGGAGSAATNAASDTLSMFSGIGSGMSDQFGDFIPKLLGAIAILVIGYIIARIVAWIVAKVVNKTGVGDKLAGLMGSAPATGKRKKGSVGKGVGSGAFWVMMMFVAIACLKALGLESVSEPLGGLLNQFFEAVPNIIKAAVIGGVGFLIATLAKMGVHKGLSLGEVDTRLRLEPGTLTNSLPLAAFGLIMLLILPAVFAALQMPELSGPIQGIVDSILGFVPKLFSAGIILAVFFLIAKLASTLLTSFLGGTGFNKIPQHLGLAANPNVNPSELAGKATMFVILLTGVTQAINLLELEVVSNLFAQVGSFVGPVLTGVVILAAGLWLANLARNAIKASSMANADSVSGMAFTGVMVMTGVIALKQMQIGGEIVDLGVGLALGGVALALGLAFGLGGRDAAAKFLDKRVK